MSEHTSFSRESASTAEAIAPDAIERRLALTQDFLDYAMAVENGTLQSGLLPHQRPAFTATATFLREQALTLEGTGNLTVSGYLDLPTSFGKTVMMAKMARAAGIGKPGPEGTRQRRALILVPSQAAVVQTIGDKEGGFGQHAPEINCTPYYSGAKDLSGDTVVMTYSSFLRLVRRIQQGEITDPQFDLILCDEAHHTLGEETRQALDIYRQGRIAIGLTATPEYGEDETIEHLFKHQIYKSELLPLIEAGVLNGVQLIGLATGSKVKAAPRKGSRRYADFVEKDLRSLRFDDDRNVAILEITKHLVAEGRRGIVNAIGGDNCDHAIMLAAALHGTEVTDAMGHTKVIRAAAIGDFVPGNERRKILNDYKAGDLDVIVQVKILNESWDEDEVGFIVNGSPTASKVVAFQRVGRGMRVSKDWPLTVIVELMDDFAGKKKPVTAWHVFEDEEFVQSKILTNPETKQLITRTHKAKTKQDLGHAATTEIAPSAPETATPTPTKATVEEEKEAVVAPAATTPTKPTPRSPLFDTGMMAERLREMSEDFTLRVSRELTIRAQKGELGPPQPGWIPLYSLGRYVSGKGMGIHALRSAIINEGNMGCELAQTPQGAQYFVPAAAEHFVRNYEVTAYAPAGYYNCADMERAWGVARTLLEATIKRLEAAGKIKAETFRSPTIKRKLNYYTKPHFDIIEAEVKARLDRIPKEEDAITLITDLAEEVGQRRNTVQFFLVRHHGITGRPATSPKYNRETTGYDATEAGIVRFHYSHIEMPKGGLPMEQLEQRLGMDETAIIARATELQLGDLLKKGRYTDAGGNYHYTLFCGADDLIRLEQAFSGKASVAVEAEEPRRPELMPAPVDKAAPTLPGTIDFFTLLSELRCNPAAARYLLRQSPFANREPIRHPTGGNALIPIDIAEVLRRRCKEIGPAPKGSASDRQLAAAWRRPLSEIHSIAASIASSGSAAGLFRTTDGTDVITIHYLPRLALPLRHVLTQKYGKPSA